MKENDPIDQEIADLSARIADNPGDAAALYARGRLMWKLGRRGEAMSDYAAAADIDPASPATEALAQARDIMEFFNKDLYNP